MPLTLKIRVGWDNDSINCVEVAQMAEAAGVDMITVHGRTRVQLYTGRSDWGLIGAVKRLRPVDGDVLLVAPDRNIRKVFEITLLDRVFPISDTLEDALARASTLGG